MAKPNFRPDKKGSVMNYKSIASLLTACLLLASCTNAYHHSGSGFWDVKSTPPLHLLEIGDEANLNEKLNIDYKITDQKIYKFAFLVEDTMRKRSDQARKSDEWTSAAQVILAAAAAAVSTASGAHPDTVALLAGASALTPDVLNIINAGVKARAYAQGLELVENANAAYIKARAEAVANKAEDIVPASLTPEGATLFVSVMATLKVMRDALLQTLPTEEDLLKAKGKYGLFSLDTNQLIIDIPQAIGANSTNGLESEDQAYFTRVISVIRGSKLAQCISDSPAVATASCQDNVLTVVPQSRGKAKINVVSESSNRTVVNVEIN
jgi:hypothetical protein